MSLQSCIVLACWNRWILLPLRLFSCSCAVRMPDYLLPGAVLSGQRGQNAVCQIVLCQLDIVKVIREAGTSVKKMPLEAWAFGKAVRHFLNQWLMGEDPVHCPWCHPWTDGPELCKKAGWASHQEQSSKQHSSMISASVLTAFDDGL